MKAGRDDVLAELALEIESNPPVSHLRTSRLEHPKMKAWLAELMRQRNAGEPRPFNYISSVLTRLGRKHGILKDDESISDSGVASHVRRSNVGK